MKPMNIAYQFNGSYSTVVIVIVTFESGFFISKRFILELEGINLDLTFWC